MKFISTFYKYFLVFWLIFTAFSGKSQDFNCLDCHEDYTLNSAHHKVVSCNDCHKDVINEDHAEKGAKNVNCGSCHTTFEKQSADDIHHSLKKIAANKIPNCKTCHGTHQIIKPKTVKNKSKEFCGKCHKTNVLTVPFHAQNIDDNSCLKCHQKLDYKKQVGSSVHTGLSCSNCHSSVANNVEGHSKDTSIVLKADCYLCHGAIAIEHKESIHGISLTGGSDEAAQCWKCHGSHNIKKVSSDSSMVSSVNLVKTCGDCHDKPDFSKKHPFSAIAPGAMFSKSVHGKLTAAGSKNSPTCVTCHGVHNIKNRIQEGSMISSVNLPNTCEKCHQKVVEDFKQSIHWLAVKKGIREAPTCNDCHNEHNIQAINSADKRKQIRILQNKTCLECHKNLLLAERYGLSNENTTNYEDSYHGLAVNAGSLKAAMCVDCHEVHKILPSSSPESSVNSKNLTATCKKCHTNATDVFAKSYSHTSNINNSAETIENIVKVVYIWLIVIVIGGMLLHNLLIFFYDLVEKYKKNKKEIRIPRFTKNELIQHTVLLTSFIMLAISGFLLKFPDTWWAKALYNFGIDETIRQYIHRTSAVIMMTLSLYHFLYLIFSARGRFILKSLLPVGGDFKAAIGNVMYFLRLKKHHPEFEHYNYIEKAEYWALIWGTLVMGATGFILWFPTVVGNWAPVWFIKVSEIVHFYEAILASLAIVVWHWFFVIFRSNEYPLSLTSIDGQMTVSHYKDEHKAAFKKVLIEWVEMKSGKRKEKELSHLTTLFLSTLKKNGIDTDTLFQSEIEKDHHLRELLKEKETENEEETKVE